MSLAIDMSGSGNEGKEYTLPKSGARTARLMSVIELGIQKNDPFQGTPKKPSQKVILGFDLVDDLDEEGVPVRVGTGNFGMTVSVDWKTKTLHEKSNLFGIVKALDPTGKKFKNDLTNLINSPCIVNVKLVTKQTSDGDRTYANFDGCGPVPDIAGFEIGASPSDPFIFDFDEPTLESWTELSEYLQTKVRESINYSGSKIQAIDETFLAQEETDVPF